MPYLQVNLDEETDKLVKRYMVDENIDQKAEAVLQVLNRSLNKKYSME